MLKFAAASLAAFVLIRVLADPQGGYRSLWFTLAGFSFGYGVLLLFERLDGPNDWPPDGE